MDRTKEGTFIGFRCWLWVRWQCSTFRARTSVARPSTQKTQTMWRFWCVHVFGWHWYLWFSSTLATWYTFARVSNMRSLTLCTCFSILWPTQLSSRYLSLCLLAGLLPLPVERTLTCTCLYVNFYLCSLYDGAHYSHFNTFEQDNGWCPWQVSYVWHHSVLFACLFQGHYNRSVYGGVYKVDMECKQITKNQAVHVSDSGSRWALHNIGALNHADCRVHSSIDQKRVGLHLDRVGQGFH